MLREGAFMDKTPFVSASQQDIRKVRPQPKDPSNYGTYSRARGRYNHSEKEPANSSSPFSSTQPPQEFSSPPDHLSSEPARYRRAPGASNRSLPLTDNGSSSFILGSSSTTNIIGLKYVSQSYRPQEPSRTHAIPVRMNTSEAPRPSRNGAHASSLNLTNLTDSAPFHFSSSVTAPTSHLKPKNSVNSLRSDDSFIDGKPLRYFRDEDSEASEDENKEEPTNGLGLTDTNGTSNSVQLLKLERENRELQLLLSQSKSTVGTLSSELSRAQFHITELNAQLKESNSKQGDLVDKLKTVTMRCIQAERKLQDTSASNTTLGQQLSRVEDENERLGDENDRLSTEINVLRSQNLGGWDHPRHRSQVKERADFASSQLEMALKDARVGIMTLLKGVDNVKRVSKILTSIDHFYPEEETSPCQSQPSPSIEPDSPASMHHGSP